MLGFSMLLSQWLQRTEGEKERMDHSEVVQGLRSSCCFQGTEATAETWKVEKLRILFTAWSFGKYLLSAFFMPAPKRHNMSGVCSNLADLTVLLERQMYKQTVPQKTARASRGNAGDDLLEDELFALSFER